MRKNNIVVVSSLEHMGKSMVSCLMEGFGILRFPGQQDYSFHRITMGEHQNTPKDIINYLYDLFGQFTKPHTCLSLSRLGTQRGQYVIFDLDKYEQAFEGLEASEFSNSAAAWSACYAAATKAYVGPAHLVANADTIAIMPRKIERSFEEFEQSFDLYEQEFDQTFFVFMNREFGSWMKTHVMSRVSSGASGFSFQNMRDYNEYQAFLERMLKRKNVLVVNFDDIFRDRQAYIEAISSHLKRTYSTEALNSDLVVEGSSVSWDKAFRPIDDKIDIVPERFLNFLRRNRFNSTNLWFKVLAKIQYAWIRWRYQILGRHGNMDELVSGTDPNHQIANHL